MHNLGMQKSLGISLGVHIIIFLLFSLFVLRNPFSAAPGQIVIEMQADSGTMTQGIMEAIEKPGQKAAPSQTQRVTQPAEKQAVPDKAVPRPDALKNFNRQKDSASRVATPDGPDPRQELKKQTETRKTPVIPVEDRKASDDLLSEEIERQKTAETLKNMSGDVDKALDESDQASTGDSSQQSAASARSGDPLSDAEWSAKPRKTLFFPDIQSKIPAEYRRKGMGYSITARIAFDRNGLATQVDIITSSGEASIDSIFFSELRKIRVEPIDEDRTDVIVKNFTISLK